jgi:hypothetical protein
MGKTELWQLILARFENFMSKIPPSPLQKTKLILTQIQKIQNIHFNPQKRFEKNFENLKKKI